MFGARQLCEDILREVQQLRRRVDQVLGRLDDPPMSVIQFIGRVDREADTAANHYDRATVLRILGTARTILRELPESQRAAMVRAWLD